MAAVLLVLPSMHLGLCILIGMVAYLGILFLLRGVTVADLRHIRGAFRKG